MVRPVVMNSALMMMSRDDSINNSVSLIRCCLDYSSLLSTLERLVDDDGSIVSPAGGWSGRAHWVRQCCGVISASVATTTECGAVWSETGSHTSATTIRRERKLWRRICEVQCAHACNSSLSLRWSLMQIRSLILTPDNRYSALMIIMPSKISNSD